MRFYTGKPVTQNNISANLVNSDRYHICFERSPDIVKREAGFHLPAIVYCSFSTNFGGLLFKAVIVVHRIPLYVITKSWSRAWGRAFHTILTWWLIGILLGLPSLTVSMGNRIIQSFVSLYDHFESNIEPFLTASPCPYPGRICRIYFLKLVLFSISGIVLKLPCSPP